MTLFRLLFGFFVFFWLNQPPVFGQKDWDSYLSDGIAEADSLFREGYTSEAKNHLIGVLTACSDKSNPEVTALAWHKTGVYDFYLDDKRKAILHFQKALSLREAIYPADHPDIIKGYFNIGNCHYQLQNYTRAKEFLKTSLQHQPDPPTSKIHDTQLLLGRVYDFSGAIEEAKEYLDAFILYSEKENADDPSNLGHDYGEVAAMYCDKPDFTEQAIQAANKGIDLVEQVKPKSEFEWGILADCYHSIGLAEQTRENWDAAVMSYKQSLNLNTLHRDNTSQARAINLNNLGIVYTKLGHFEAAIIALEAAITINKEQGAIFSLAANYDNLGDVWAGKGDLPKALGFYQKGLASLLDTVDENDMFNNPKPDADAIGNKSQFLILLSSKASGFFDLYKKENKAKDLKAAWQTYQLLVEWIDLMREDHLSQESKIFLAEKTKPVITGAIETNLIYYRQNGEISYLENAFQLAEKSKAIVLLEAWKTSNARGKGALPPELLQQEEQLKFDITWYKQEKYKLEQTGQATVEQRQRLADSILVAKQRYAVLLEQIKTNHPKFLSLVNKDRLVDITALRNELSESGSTLVELVVGIDQVITFVLSGDTFFVEETPFSGSLVSMVDSLRLGLFACRLPDAQMTCTQGNDLYIDFARRIYNLLLRPVEDRLTGNLIIIPDDVLGYIPFEALLYEKPDTLSNDFRQLPYLLRKHRVSYAYSSALLQEVTEHRKDHSTGNLLAFAPSFSRVFFATDDLDQNLAATGNRATLSPLIFNEEEVSNILSITSGKQFTAEMAKRQVFMDEATKYRFIHLSSHGFVNDEDPRYSFIAFSQTGNQLNFDELLFVSDLYSLSLNADMVVLSACNTGFGKLNRGEGIMSLARAFTYAGAKSIITSLWSVNDQKTALLMQGYYQHLKEGQPKDKALQLAKLHLIDDLPGSAHPFFWAGFIPIGNMQAVALGGSFSVFLWGIPILILLAGLWFFIRRNRHPKLS